MPIWSDGQSRHGARNGEMDLAVMNDIIPFGKYRGQEIEQVRQRDPAYLQWLVQQGWFSEKFAPIYQLVINNFAPPSDETPAHNTLQVRFLDFDFQVAFWYASGSDDDVEWANLVQGFNKGIEHSNLRKAPKPYKRPTPSGNAPENFFWEAHRAEVRRKWATWRYRNKRPRQMRSFGPAAFEDVSDVVFKLTASIGWGEKAFNSFDVDVNFEVYIEIKPSMGDDYPAVLRQMKRQQQRQQEQRTLYARTIWCMLVDQFASQAVTLEQVRKIFERDNIKIVMMQDVRDYLIKRKSARGT